MAVVYIEASKPKNHPFPILSWAIRLVEGTEYSHVYIRWWDENSSDYLVFEAMGKKVQISKYSELLKKREVIKSVKLSINVHQKATAIKLMYEMEGIPYGLIQLAGMLLAKMANLLGFKTKNPFTSKRESMVCSEAVGYVLRDALGIPIPYDMDLLSPKEVMSIVARST